MNARKNGESVAGGEVAKGRYLAIFVVSIMLTLIVVAMRLGGYVDAVATPRANQDRSRANVTATMHSHDQEVLRDHDEKGSQIFQVAQSGREAVIKHAGAVQSRSGACGQAARDGRIPHTARAQWECMLGARPPAPAANIDAVDGVRIQ